MQIGLWTTPPSNRAGPLQRDVTLHGIKLCFSWRLRIWWTCCTQSKMPSYSVVLTRLCNAFVPLGLHLAQDGRPPCVRSVTHQGLVYVAEPYSFVADINPFPGGIGFHRVGDIARPSPDNWAMAADASAFSSRSPIYILVPRLVVFPFFVRVDNPVPGHNLASWCVPGKWQGPCLGVTTPAHLPRAFIVELYFNDYLAKPSTPVILYIALVLYNRMH